MQHDILLLDSLYWWESLGHQNHHSSFSWCNFGSSKFLLNNTTVYYWLALFCALSLRTCSFGCSVTAFHYKFPAIIALLILNIYHMDLMLHLQGQASHCLVVWCLCRCFTSRDMQVALWVGCPNCHRCVAEIWKRLSPILFKILSNELVLLWNVIT